MTDTTPHASYRAPLAWSDVPAASALCHNLQRHAATGPAAKCSGCLHLPSSSIYLQYAGRVLCTIAMQCCVMSRSKRIVILLPDVAGYACAQAKVFKSSPDEACGSDVDNKTVTPDVAYAASNRLLKLANVTVRQHCPLKPIL